MTLLMVVFTSFHTFNVCSLLGYSTIVTKLYHIIILWSKHFLHIQIIILVKTFFIFKSLEEFDSEDSLRLRPIKTQNIDHIPKKKCILKCTYKLLK